MSGESIEKPTGRAPRGRTLARTAAVAAGLAAAVLALRAAVAALAEREGRGYVGERWVTAGEHRIFTRVGLGTPPSERVPVVLVHGAVISSLYMIPTLARLAPEFPVFAPDLPGYGASSSPRRTLSVSELADALRLWMDAMGLKRAAMLGNSLGCQVIADLAARHPERVERLVLVGPTLEPDSRSAEEVVARLLMDIPRERLSQLPMHVLDHLRAGPLRVIGTMHVALADRIEANLARVTAPTLIVRGERDPIVSHEWAECLARLSRADRLLEIAAAPHALNYSAPDVLVSEIRRFLLEGAP